MKRKFWYSLFGLGALLIASSAQATWSDPAIEQHAGDDAGNIDVAVNDSGVAVTSYGITQLQKFITRISTDPATTWSSEADGTHPATIGNLGKGKTAIAINNSSDVISYCTNESNTLYFLWSVAGAVPFNSDEYTVVGDAFKSAINMAMDPARSGDIAFGMALYERGDNIYALPVWVDIGGPSINFGTEQLIGPGGISGDARDNNVVFDGSGNAYVVYEDKTSAKDTTFVKFTRTGATTGTWGSTTLISNGTDAADKQQIGVDSSGNVVIVWRNHDGSDYTMQARTITSTGTLSPIQTISGADTIVDHVSLGMNSNGQAIAGWFEKTSDTNQIVRANFIQSIPDNTWGEPINVATLTEESKLEGETAVAIGEAGEGVAVITWDDKKHTDNPVQSVFLWYNGTEWVPSTQTPVPSSAGEAPSSVVVEMNILGDAIVGWKNDSAKNVYTNFSSHVFPFVNGVGKRKHVRFFTQTELFNRISWENNPHENGTVAYYKVYRNNLSNFIGTFSPTSSLSFEDHNRDRFLDKYLIITVLDTGDESFPFSIQVED